ncbi:hypothetical protein NIES4071_106180 (plasmid) [Calothrix sp. NIES-4071]|nr:hypothetical protein NIES4071_106180 [Calothrix sp. NIES-4071]BAZ65036.1 hypothetical protein NIES4105_107690 [Calothrix sp. NIES-4105]
MTYDYEEVTYLEWQYLKQQAAFERNKFEIERCYGVDYDTYLAIKKQKKTPIDYENFPARPTKFKGQYFRSKLEATWAAFFEQVMEGWEYEPSDALDHFLGWRPDFQIWIHNEPIYCEVKPLWLGTLPDWLKTKICDAESARIGQRNNSVKVAILGNAVPIGIEGRPSLGYISLKRQNNDRDWLPFTVVNAFVVNEKWLSALSTVNPKQGLTHINDCLTSLFTPPVEDFFSE